MAREKAKQLLPIIQAYAEGKTIEWFSAIDGAKWEELTQPLFDARMQYRIKPEEVLIETTTCKEKQYRPFKDSFELIETFQKKCDEEMDCKIVYPKLYKPCIWVKHKEYGTENLITAFDNNNGSIGANVIINDMDVTMKMLFDNYTFCDGSVCGVIE